MPNHHTDESNFYSTHTNPDAQIYPGGDKPSDSNANLCALERHPGSCWPNTHPHDHSQQRTCRDPDPIANRNLDLI
jgi:hypothetical protein